MQEMRKQIEADGADEITVRGLQAFALAQIAEDLHKIVLGHVTFRTREG